MHIREALEKRATLETEIEIFLRLDGQQKLTIDLPIPFFPHLLKSMAFYAQWDLTVHARGDIVEVDSHHLIEDTGIVLGDAFRHALGNDQPIRRFSTFFIPMDESFSMAAVDLGGRPFLVYEAPELGERVGDFETFLIEEFLRAFVNHAQITLHTKIWWGKNGHHCLESLFKALGKTLGEAAEFSGNYIPSTKGTI